MSIGAPSNLGTLLIQRLDAALGTTLGQQANLVSGAGPQAVPQPGNPENPNALQNPTRRDTREAVDQANAEGQRRAAVGKAGREMQLDNLLGRSTTFQGATQSAPTTLGYAARIILALLNQFPQASQTIQGRAPLLTPSGQPGGNTAQAGAAPGAGGQPPATGAQGQTTSATQIWAQMATNLNQPGALAARFTQALSQSIQNSGLFYESHVAQLAAGKTSAQALRQEPQGQMTGHTLPPAAQAGGSPASLSSIIQQAQASTQEAGTSAGTSTGNTSPTQPGANHTAPQAPPPNTTIPGIDPQAQFLVRQQLEVLANQGFIWQGEAWPGADMQWEVRRRQPGDGETPAVPEEHWATRLNLQLPTLGQVEARLSLSGDQLVMRLTAPQSADRLTQSIEPLRSRLLAQGLQASQLSVLERNPEDPDAAITPITDSDPAEHEIAAG
ncbi:flagellar hook-length control protein FliK [Castellaniella sp.]|uniref:flagellar hook-length control protein FliK n=1 Tax=Castellaniella sp. TaxID=1955812 RepID=UPI002AFF4258|nr:flagellar hook-length control protein FliK [Castellaniella sp.]